MKLSKLFNCLFYISILLLVLASCATEKESIPIKEFYNPEPNEMIFGTWVNPDYEITTSPGGEISKVILYSWGYAEAFTTISDADTQNFGTYYIIDRWTDSDGYIWYKFITLIPNTPSTPYCTITKINKSGDTREEIYALNRFIQESEWSTDHTNYRIFYRQ